MSAELQVVEGERQREDKLVGSTIDGRYEVEGVLGEGGMGLVYKARHIVLNKPLALKVLRPDVSKDAEIITRFRQEAQSASAIGNQHIIDISDFGTLEDGSTYFIMEFLDGVDLTGAIESTSGMEVARTIHIAKQLCRALGAAHEAGIVHRDLKPDNVYLIKRGSDSNFVKVLDFGIAKVGGNSSKLTRAGQVFGTPHYMSPEQCSGSGVDHRTDVYALGIMLYEMLTGAVPFDADNLMGILTKHLYEQPVAPRDLKPEIPEEVELVVLKAIEKTADERYQNMEELLEDLERLEAGVGTYARETTKAVSLESAAPARGGSKMPLLAGLAVLLIGGGVAAAVTLSGEEPPPEPVAQPEPVVAPEPIVAPEPEVAEAPEPEAAAEPEPPARVTITSDPEGAEVWLGNELIGNAPIRFPKPEEEARTTLELRLPGHESRQFTISSYSQDEMRISLERERSRRRGRRRALMDEAPAQTPMMSMRPRTQSEVLDPWASE